MEEEVLKNPPKKHKILKVPLMYNHKKMHLHFVVKMQVMILCVLYLYQLSTKN